MPKVKETETLDVQATQVEEVVAPTDLPVSSEDVIEATELRYYNKLVGEYNAGRQQLENANRELENLRSDLTRKEGALSSYSAFLKEKYNINENDVVDVETGAIQRV